VGLPFPLYFVRGAREPRGCAKAVWGAHVATEP
jgi:hypothetical protein